MNTEVRDVVHVDDGCDGYYSSPSLEHQDSISTALLGEIYASEDPHYARKIFPPGITALIVTDTVFLWVPLPFGLYIPSEVAHFWPGVFIAYPFLHENFYHLCSNMLLLWMCGGAVEREMGTKRFLWFYMASAMCCGIASFIWHGYQFNSIGASGAVSAVMVATVFCVRSWLGRIPAVLILALCIPDDLSHVSDVGIPDRIDHIAHLGGYASGLIFAIILLAVHKLHGGELVSLWSSRRSNLLEFDDNGRLLPSAEPPQLVWTYRLRRM